MATSLGMCYVLKLLKLFKVNKMYNQGEEYVIGYGILQTNGALDFVNDEGCGNIPEIDLDALNEFLKPKKKQYLMKTMNLFTGEDGADAIGICIVEADSEDEAIELCLKSLHEEECEDFEEDDEDKPTFEDTEKSWEVCVHSLLEDVYTINKQ